MVLPDVARFAVFGCVVVILNFVAVIIGFTALLSLVSRRQKSGYRDWAFLCCFTECTKYSNTDPEATSDPNTAPKEGMTTFDSCFDVLVKTPVRLTCLLFAVVLLIIGVIGITEITAGLPLEEIVPADSYAFDFLSIRGSYYFTYSNSLYTDADGANNAAIDWPNKFED
eukprot:319480_1